MDRQSRQEWTTSQRYHFHRNHRFDLALHYPSFLGRFHFPRFLWRCTYYRCLRSHSRFEVSRVYSTLFVIVPLTILHFSSGSSSLEVISPTPSGRTVDSLFPSVLSLASGTVSSNPFSLISGKHKLNFGVSFLSSLPPRRPLLSSRIPRQRRERNCFDRDQLRSLFPLSNRVVSMIQLSTTPSTIHTETKLIM